MTGPAAVVVDARGLLCPQPVLMLARAAKELPGALIEVLADDPAAATDIPAWCGMRDARLVAVEPQSDHVAYLVCAGPGKAGGSQRAAGSRSR